MPWPTIRLYRERTCDSREICGTENESNHQPGLAATAGYGPIGAQGAAAIDTKGGAWAAVRKITIRIHSWFNWLYPMPF